MVLPPPSPFPLPPPLSPSLHLPPSPSLPLLHISFPPPPSPSFTSPSLPLPPPPSPSLPLPLPPSHLPPSPSLPHIHHPLVVHSFLHGALTVVQSGWPGVQQEGQPQLPGGVTVEGFAYGDKVLQGLGHLAASNGQVTRV